MGCHEARARQILVKKLAGLMRPGRKIRRKNCRLVLSLSQSSRMSIDFDFFGRLNQHLPTAKSGSVLRLCHRRYHHGYALAVGMEERCG
jgi:hypothetical protein